MTNITHITLSSIFMLIKWIYNTIKWDSRAQVRRNKSEKSVCLCTYIISVQCCVSAFGQLYITRIKAKLISRFSRFSFKCTYVYTIYSYSYAENKNAELSFLFFVCFVCLYFSCCKVLCYSMLYKTLWNPTLYVYNNIYIHINDSGFWLRK